MSDYTNQELREEFEGTLDKQWLKGDKGIVFEWVVPEGKPHLSRYKNTYAWLMYQCFVTGKESANQQLAASEEARKKAGEEFTKAIDRLTFEIDRRKKAEAELARLREPVVITDSMAYAFHNALSDGSLSESEVEEIKTGLRAAFANAEPKPTADVAEYKKDLETARRMLANEMRKSFNLMNEVQELKQANALYESDSERIWALMPELRNTGAHFELHEAVQEKLSSLERKLAEQQAIFYDTDGSIELTKLIAQAKAEAQVRLIGNPIKVTWGERFVRLVYATDAEAPAAYGVLSEAIRKGVE